MDDLHYYQLINKRRAEYFNAPTEINELAEAECRKAFDEEMDSYDRLPREQRHGRGEADADAHYAGIGAANRIWEAWRVSIEADKRDLTYELYTIPWAQIPIVQEINDELLTYLARNPNMLHQLSSRKFEELVASILRNSGFNVDITNATRDGGVDIYAWLKNSISEFLVLVECKKYSEHRPVGVEVVRRLYGVQQQLNAPKSMVITTSCFTKPAQDFRRAILDRMELKDFADLKTWLRRWRNDA